MTFNPLNGATTVSRGGEDGKSAYEISKDNGFEGSEKEWIDSLRGKDGDPGKDGSDGEDGDPGKDGSDGEDGKDGYPSEEEWKELKDKVEDLEEGE